MAPQSDAGKGLKAVIATLHVLLVVTALILLVLAALGVGHPRINLMAAGLACWLAATQLVT
jgi:hypothetical protein